MAPPRSNWSRSRRTVAGETLSRRHKPGLITPSGLTANKLILEAPENKNFVDPLYGKTYLPRKFKIAFAIPPVNDLDIFTNCLGLIAIVENDRLTGYNLAVALGVWRLSSLQQGHGLQWQFACAGRAVADRLVGGVPRGQRTRFSPIS